MTARNSLWDLPRISEGVQKGSDLRYPVRGQLGTDQRLRRETITPAKAGNQGQDLRIPDRVQSDVVQRFLRLLNAAGPYTCMMVRD